MTQNGGSKSYLSVWREVQTHRERCARGLCGRPSSTRRPLQVPWVWTSDYNRARIPTSSPFTDKYDKGGKRMTEKNEEYLCPTCLYRDGSCGDGTTSWGGTVTSCHAFVLAQENIWCRLGFHNWDFGTSLGGGYNENLARECRRCRRVEIKLKGDIFWRASSEEEMWWFVKHFQRRIRND